MSPGPSSRKNSPLNAKPCRISTTSPSAIVGQGPQPSDFIPNPRKRGPDFRGQPLVLCHLLGQLIDERRALAEPRLIGVVGGGCSSPRVVAGGDPLDLLLGELDLGAADLAPHLPGVDEQRLPSPVALAA